MGQCCGKTPEPSSSPPATVVQLPQPTQAASSGAPGALPAVRTAFQEAHSILDSLIEAPGTPLLLARELRQARALLNAQQETAAARAEVAAATARAEVAAAAARAEVAAARHEVLELQLKEVTADYLTVRGSLHSRGLMEYVEQHLRPPHLLGSKVDRKSLWEALCVHQEALVAAILKANTHWKATWIPDKAVALYGHLSAQMHATDIKASGNKMLLVEGYLSQEEVRFLQCMAEAVHCPYEVRYQQLPSASTQGE